MIPYDSLVHLLGMGSKRRSSDRESVAMGPHLFYKGGMRWFVLAALMGMGSASAEPCNTPEDCGIAPTVIPDFTLVDVNPNSTTFGEERSRDEFLGSVLVVYFAQAT